MDRHIEVTVGPEGRILIPADVRRAAGLEPGSILLVRLEGERVVLTPRDAAKKRLRRMFEGVDGSMAEELIAERRREAEREVAGE
jgi:AbrB family looped-hinge helix DNA binding protein